VPGAVNQTQPGNWDIRWEIFRGGQLLHSYQREESISFGQPENYFTLPGVSTFRGNNYRNSATYGTAQVVDEKLGIDWTKNTGNLSGSSWSGNGWTGQPVIVQWDAETRKNMNLYADKKEKDGLVEVIYASLDGVIYFLDLDDGKPTRDPLNVGMCFKGAGTLDPRGYPLLYVGSGDENSQGKRPRMFIINLINGRILYENGYDEALSYRKDNDEWCAFDSAPLIHAETDTLIWPGESGILYTMKLNSRYDRANGTVEINPSEPVVTRYHTGRSSEEKYWYGYEASVVMVENYLYVSENGGMFFCIDINTMELVWAQDTKDDSNSTPVFEPAEDGGAVYTAPSLHWTKDANSKGTISIYKLDALTGQIIWEKPYNVHTVEGVSGGVQSSPLLGKPGTTLDGMILYTISRTKTVSGGTLVALDTETGNEVWRWDMNAYAWSSPVAVYDESGKAYVVVCDSAGNATLLDGASGTVLHQKNLGGLVEASPAVFEDTLVIGTRARQICGIKVY
jgi:outer membrane protein assembly factor BamB